MINIKKFLNNVRQEYPHQNLMEDSFASLRSKSDDGRKLRASGIPAYYQNIEQSSDGQARTNWIVNSQSDSSTKYECTVEIITPNAGGLFAVAKSKWDPRKFADTLKASDVRVACTCPDFWWGGQTYNLGSKGNYKGNLAAGANMTDLAPNIRDPKREHVLCKHLIAVFNVFPSNSFKIMGDARKYDANLETDEKATNDIEQGKAVLNKEKELFSIPETDKEVITDALYNGAEELSKNQDNEGAEEIIDEQNETTQELATPDSPMEPDEIIGDEDDVNIDITDDEPAPEVGEMIEDENRLAREEIDSNELLGETESEEDNELEKDKDITEESDVSDDPNELLNRS